MRSITHYVITDDNIDQLRSEARPGVIYARWEIKGPCLDAKVLANLPNLRTLDCSNSKLISPAGIECCPKLESLHCPDNNLQSLVCAGVCPCLTRIECSKNPLVSLSGLENYPKLTILNCSRTSLASLDGLEHCPQLETLNCGFCAIRQLGSKGEHNSTGLYGCTRLLDLNCAYNLLKYGNCSDYFRVSPEPFEPLNALIHLHKLNITGTRIPSIKLIQRCVELTVLNCSSNDLSSLDGIESLTKLETLDCSRNSLTSLEGIEGLVYLHNLDCNYNRLSSIVSLANCMLLTRITCNSNELVTLAGVENCSRLEVLMCGANHITHLENVVHLRTIRCFYYHNNPLAIQSPAAQRFCDRVQGRSSNSIYDDAQNVHNIHVQRSVCRSLVNLLADGKHEFSIDCIINSSLDRRTIQLLLEYCGDLTIHSVHLLTYQELLGYVWARIMGSEHKPELLKILAEQIHDSECKCFTGRFNRTLSVLVGFYPDIVIAISDSSRIGAIIIAIKDRIRPYDPIVHKSTAHRELLEAGYTEDEIRVWIEAIDDAQ